MESSDALTPADATPAVQPLGDVASGQNSAHFTLEPGTAQHGVVPDGSTRQRVISSILHNGPSTAAELADRLGLTAAAVRRHLTTLTEDGVVESREQRVFGARGRGRPSRVFCLTDSGRADYYTAYDALAIAALRQLARAGGPDALNAVAQARVDDIEARYRTLREQDPRRDPVEALAEALSADGYAASTVPAAVGQQICQHNCPVAEVAKAFPQMCEAETQLFSELLGSRVQRLATIAHGDGVCTTYVPIDVDLIRRRNPLPSQSTDGKL